jgi:hypothetical protein
MVQLRDPCQRGKFAAMTKRLVPGHTSGFVVFVARLVMVNHGA